MNLSFVGYVQNYIHRTLAISSIIRLRAKRYETFRDVVIMTISFNRYGIVVGSGAAEASPAKQTLLRARQVLIKYERNIKG